MNNGKWGWFLVDKLVADGLDGWEVKIADFVVLLAKDAKKFLVPQIELNVCGKKSYVARKGVGHEW